MFTTFFMDGGQGGETTPWCYMYVVVLVSQDQWDIFLIECVQMRPCEFQFTFIWTIKLHFHFAPRTYPPIII